MAKKTVGTIVTPPGVFTSVHEKKTVDFLAIERGADITFLVPNRMRGERTPDIEMEGRQWEIKCPRGRSPRTIENNLRIALLQSRYIVLDLRRLDGRVPTYKHVAEISRQFDLTKAIRHLIVITREEKVIDFQR